MAMPGRPWNAITRLAAMLGQKRLAGALAVAAIAVAISACGSSDSKSIPQEDADQLLSALTAVQTAIDNRECEQAQEQAQNFVQAVNALPETVGTEDKETLRTAGENLEELAADPNQCKPEPIGTTDVPDTTSSTTSIPPETTETTTSSTTTTTTSSEPPPTDSGGGPPTDTGGGPPSDTGGGPPTDTGGGDTGGGDTGGGVGGGSGGTGGTGTGGTGGTG
jgi:uncharacterized membrane protein YgcG